jgi:phosphoribosylformylglycinamidine synthase subunit PurS
VDLAAFELDYSLEYDFAFILKFLARVEVRTGKGQFDPESETIRKSLLDLGFQLAQVRTAKVYEIHMEAESNKDAEKSVRSMCSKLLVNPVKDDFSVEVVQLGGSSAKS